MKIIKYPHISDYQEICSRPRIDTTTLNGVVNEVLSDIRQRGDDAVKAYELKFDHVELKELRVTESEIEEAYRTIDCELRDAIQLAHDNIKAFHESQIYEGKKIETSPGVCCWQKSGRALPKKCLRCWVIFGRCCGCA